MPKKYIPSEKSIDSVISYLKRTKILVSINRIRAVTGVHNYTIQEILREHKNKVERIRSSNGYFYRWIDGEDKD